MSAREKKRPDVRLTSGAPGWEPEKSRSLGRLGMTISGSRLAHGFRDGRGKLAVGGDEELIGVFYKVHGVGAVNWVWGLWACASKKE